VELLTRGFVDLAIAHDWQGMPLALPEGAAARHLGDDVSDVLVPVTHRLADAASVDLEDLGDDGWLYEPGSVAHDFLLHAYRDAPDGARFGHMVTEYASQIAMVRAGLGLALVPRMGRGPLPEGVRALSLASAPVRRIYGVWREASGPRPALHATLQTLADALTGRPSAGPV
ncbi:MAG: LysR family transcriptional regulator, partial [Propionibacteriaceae bacterium]